MMKTTMKIILLQVLLATRSVVFCDEKNIDFLSTKNDTEIVGTSQMLFNPKTHIEKFIDSWRYYAKANDIAKREKLKLALRDALHSIERPEKHSSISGVGGVDMNSAKRIKEAAVLLKEFKEMYSLSQTVKKTLGDYQDARKKLVSHDMQGPRDDIEALKGLLQKSGMANKRDMIPSYSKTQKSFIDRAVDSNWLPEGTVQLEKPIVIKRTNRISVRANPLKNGEVGFEYSSIDPRYSNVEQAEKAMRAAVIVLKYSGANKKQDRKSSFPAPMRHWDDEEKSTTKTTIPAAGKGQEKIKPVVNSVVESLVNGDEELPAEDKEAIESLGKDSNFDASHLIKSGGKTNVKKEIVNKYVGQLKQLYARYLKIKGENDTVENALQFQNEIINSNLGNVSKDLLDSGESKASSSEEKPMTEDESKEKADTKADVKDDDKYTPKPGSDDINKQEDTLKQLKEARQAKVRYEIAKHELAHKIKELYVLANNYEKDETENQILEVKNLISHTPNPNEANNKDNKEDIPGSHAIEKSDIAASQNPTPAYESVSNEIKARDEVHPGIALGISDHASGKDSSDKEEDKHKGLTMGTTDKTVHQVDSPGSQEKSTHKEDSQSNAEKTAHLVDSLSSLEKSADSPKDAGLKSEYDYLHLPAEHKADAKKEEGGGGGGGKEKHDDDTLSIIAQAIQEDMKEIKKDDQKEEGSKEEAISALSKLHNASTEHEEKENKELVSENKEGNKEKEEKLHVHEMGDTKQDLTYSNESVDDYLTKALSDIISQDGISNNQETGLTEHVDSGDEKVERKENDPSEENKNVVEKAMRQHAKNPNLPLPLVDTKGDKIKLNPALNSTSNEDASGPIQPNESNVKQAANATVTTDQPNDVKTTDASPAPASAAVPPEEGKRPAEASKEAPKPDEVLLHVTDKNISTAVPDLDLHDPENKQLLEKASHMEESIAAAQDKLYSETDPEVEGHKVAAAVETSSKEKDSKEDTSSRDKVQDIKPDSQSLPAAVASVGPPPLMPEESAAMRPSFSHRNDPYLSIQEHASLSNHVPVPVDMADMDPEDAYDDEEEPPPLHHHRHHHHRHRHHHRRHHHDDEMEPEGDEPADAAESPDADVDEEDDEGDAPDDAAEDDEDDDDEDADKKSKIRYMSKNADKRSFINGTVPANTTTDTAAGNSDPSDPVHIDELEDLKRSGIPKNAQSAASKGTKRNFKGEKRKKNGVTTQNQRNIVAAKAQNVNPLIRGTEMQINRNMIKMSSKQRIEELEDAKRSTIPFVHKKEDKKSKISRTFLKAHDRRIH